jgi:hypothetical protein
MAENPERDAAKIGLPPRVFLYTLDQIAFLIDVTEATLKSSYVHYEGRSLGAPGRDKIAARNIAPADTTPDWRVSETVFIRWLKFKGYKLLARGYVS